jgi:hypothetical protein
MKARLFGVVASIIATLIAIPSSRASTLFQSVPDLTGPTYLSGVCSACFGSYRVFDTFSLASNASIDAVTVGVYPNPFPTDMSVSIWSISGGAPATQLFTETFTPEQFVSAVAYPDRVLVTVDPISLVLAAGTYDISFYNADGLALIHYYGGAGLFYQQGNFVSDLGGSLGGSLGFVLSGDALTTPLPAALPLFATGLGALGLLGWRRKRK